ncbi:conjugal transfer transcriptional regulator TraJ [Aeromonas salmonicida subsp. achromogenes]|uniref:conjugal transfer transcriptional regulator TraJ n=1 Tax=Aeromonas salmonicida TaxID=645 RepID=UPI000379DB64|nr:conjugal transfer transcriptional regulator TraJ [Aeromonas salmonicida]HAT3955926.1 conjugal transfer transcriptional regulator TraJ [Kluyvera ascorbata]TMX14327.1 conjugal transfer transcriptional regulator TraJ [Aeromonas salmonicida subsp. achromogenes]TMX17973.1 conjugal transfer transcriptional regulator TraJ [Aeromonas salmonicida subsp. achromogenes]TMX18721.1 conjugal transfer transcriptional regulator TraJ [Aeromonas salmonicida subsp. achromogenes]TMX21335.1 conjugal transfer tra
MTDTPNRKNTTPIKVYCLPEEKAQIQANAAAAGLSVAAYLRKVGMGYEVDAWVDIEQVKELSRVNGDLGRLGGLLKMWLSNDARTQNFSPALINTLLTKIESTQEELRAVMTQVLSK